MCKCNMVTEMDYEKRILEYLKISNGIITARYCRENQIPTIYLTRLVRNGLLKKVFPGIYLTENGDYDELYFFQCRYPKTIYSYETAANLLGVSDKIVHQIDVTVNWNYRFNNLPSNVKVHYVKREWLNMGAFQSKTMFGNPVNVYSYERILCDLIKNREKTDSETYVKLIRGYSSYEKRDLENLYKIASIMGIRQKISDILELAYE